jgi:hypothetical protein
LLFSGETVLAYEHFARSHSPRIDCRHCLHFHQLVLDGISFSTVTNAPHPETWRPEGPRKLRTLQSGTGAFRPLRSPLFTFWSHGFRSAFSLMEWWGALRFAALIWIALSAPVAIEAAIYVRMHSMVVLGAGDRWLTTAIVACAITFLWITA